MDNICRLCCSTKYVHNYIFDEENALYMKMSLYLPIKVLKDDRMPQKICDKCSCKVNDLYQFCNDIIDAQDRLRTILLQSDDAADKPQIVEDPKQNSQPLPAPNATLQKLTTQTDNKLDDKSLASKSVEIKVEPIPPSPSSIKVEDDYDDSYVSNVPSDDSEDVCLVNLKKSKRCKKENTESKNGEVKDSKRGKKRKGTLKDIESLLTERSVLEENLVQYAGVNLNVVKEEGEKEEVDVLLGLRSVKQEGAGELTDVHYCCMCFIQCNSRTEMLKHYKWHASKADTSKEQPPPPPPPDTTPLRCPRCRKTLSSGEWGAHWRRHLELDRRPYRCALCEKTFRDHHQILKHGKTHKLGDSSASSASSQDNVKRFVCDLCPEEFIYMRCVLAHRARAHPEAALRALELRCALCGRRFAHVNSLRRHLRAHSGERNFLCNVCGKALSSREHLKFHIRIHTGYKPNVCKTCGKGFVKKCNLTLHERVHSGEKPHVCSHCGKAFSQRSTLVIHERYHSGARPYTCGVCGRGFVAKGLLSMHLKTSCVDGPHYTHSSQSRS